jgi:hypothetical protein
MYSLTMCNAEGQLDWHINTAALQYMLSSTMFEHYMGGSHVGSHAVLHSLDNSVSKRAAAQKHSLQGSIAS